MSESVTEVQKDGRVALASLQAGQVVYCAWVLADKPEACFYECTVISPEDGIYRDHRWGKAAASLFIENWFLTEEAAREWIAVEMFKRSRAWSDAASAYLNGTVKCDGKKGGDE